MVSVLPSSSLNISGDLLCATLKQNMPRVSRAGKEKVFVLFVGRVRCLECLNTHGTCEYGVSYPASKGVVYT